jgi:hypothetical protein
MYLYSPQALQSQILPSVIKNAAQELLSGKYPKTINELAINGNDLMELGLKDKEIGDMQKSLLLKIYSDNVRNNREDLLNLASQNKNVLKEQCSNLTHTITSLLYEVYPEDKYLLGAEQLKVNYLVKKYDEWNRQGEIYPDPTRATVLEFLQKNYPDLVNDEEIKKNLYWKLIDREVLKEDVLNEMSIQTIDYTDIITPEYIKELEMSDNYERYVEYYQYEHNLVDTDKEEIKKTEDFKNWLTYELRARFDDVIDNINNKINPDGTIDIWRRIKVDDIWVNHLIQAGKHLGIYWSWDEHAAEAHWGDTAKNSNALIKSSINEKYIDWNNTIDANMNLVLGEDEKEITLFKNTSLKIEELYIDGQDVEDVMGSDYELQVRNKIFYA